MLPPLNPLRVFDVAARLGSFTRAAAELGVTQAAVSRQIATLEDFLGIQLFWRERAGTVLTPAGEAYRDEISPAFQVINAASEKVIERRRFEPLQIAVYPTFAAKWLIPRLPRLQSFAPDIALRLNTTVKPFKLADSRSDIAIQLGRGNWPGLEAYQLFPDIIQPVCNPRLLAEKRLHHIDDLAHFPMLHARYRKADWGDWLAAVSKKHLYQDGMTFSSSLLTYQAATDGLGIAMGQVPLLKRDFLNGTLIALFKRPVERPLGFYVLWKKNAGENVRRFVNWIKRELNRDA